MFLLRFPSNTIYDAFPLVNLGTCSPCILYSYSTRTDYIELDHVALFVHLPGNTL